MKEKKLHPDASLKDLQTYQMRICKERGWDQANPTETFLLFSEEIGELAKEMRKQLALFTEKGKDPADNSLAFEFADVFSYLLELANHFGVDVASSYVQKMKINETREWNS